MVRSKGLETETADLNKGKNRSRDRWTLVQIPLKSNEN